MKGSLEKRGKNSWRLVVSCGLGPDGKQVKKTKTVRVETSCEEESCKGCAKLNRCRARKGAEKLLAEFVVEIEKGMYIEPSKLTFKDFVEKWIQDYAESNLDPKTLHRYKEILDSRILPAMGHLRLDQIKPMHLVEFYKNLQEDGIRKDGKPGGLSPKTILQHHRIISSILNDAVEWQIIKENPVTRVKPPRVKKKKTECYDKEQTMALLAALDGEPLKYKTMVMLTIATGLRRGEMLGLEWQDVDFKNNTIDVHKATQYVPRKGVFVKSPKTEESTRLITVPASVMALLKEYKKQQTEERLKMGNLWQAGDKLFTNRYGQPLHPDYITHWFSEFLERHNLPHIRFHDLRHLNATLLIAEGVPLKNVSKRLGHSNISTTADIYTHALQSVDQEAANKLDGLFKSSTKTKKQG